MFAEPPWTQNGQWAHMLIVLLCLFVGLITSRCQLQGSGTACLKNAPTVCMMPGSRELPAGPACLWVSGAPLAKQGHTNWLLVMFSSTCTHWLGHWPTHMFMHYFYTVIHAHACLNRGQHTWFPNAHKHDRCQHTHTGCIHTHTHTRQTLIST